MVRYLSLISYTDKGLAAIKDSPQRASQFAEQVAKAGGKVVSMLWSTGEFDGCILFEVPDAQTGASLLLRLNQLGHVRTRTMQVFDEGEFSAIVDHS
jgi:uncharacterized protein with GYD domain